MTFATKNVLDIIWMFKTQYKNKIWLKLLENKFWNCIIFLKIKKTIKKHNSKQRIKPFINICKINWLFYLKGCVYNYLNQT